VLTKRGGITHHRRPRACSCRLPVWQGCLFACVYSM